MCFGSFYHRCLQDEFMRVMTVVTLGYNNVSWCSSCYHSYYNWPSLAIMCFESWCISIISNSWFPFPKLLGGLVTGQGINRRLIAWRQCWRRFIRSGHGENYVSAYSSTNASFVGGTMLPKRCPSTYSQFFLRFFFPKSFQVCFTSLAWRVKYYVAFI